MSRSDPFEAVPAAEPAPVAAEPGKPDAVLLDRKAPGASHRARVMGTLNKVEPLLGGQAYIRDVGGDRILATRSPHDTLFFPTDHDRSGEERYDWTDGPDGVRLGTLRKDDQ